MKINIVTVQSGWILQKIAERIVESAPRGFKMTLSHLPVIGGNNFYVDISNCYRGPTGGIDIGLFTHVHENNAKYIKDYWFLLDYIVHMSYRSFEIFCQDPRYSVESPPMDYKMVGEVPQCFEYKKPTIGVFQRGEHEGKGFHLMKNLVSGSRLPCEFKWVFVGGGWEGVVDKLRGVTEVLYANDSNTDWPARYKEYYDLVDYVLVPSKWEGGPMSLIEAASLGKQIIAAPVGWAGIEIPVDYSFKNGDVESLRSCLFSIVGNRRTARDIVEELSYKDYSSYICGIFEELNG